MKTIITTWDNKSFIVNMPFGQCFICTELGGYGVSLVSIKEIKLISRGKNVHRDR